MWTSHWGGCESGAFLHLTGKVLLVPALHRFKKFDIGSWCPILRRPATLHRARAVAEVDLGPVVKRHVALLPSQMLRQWVPWGGGGGGPGGWPRCCFNLRVEARTSKTIFGVPRNRKSRSG